MHIFGYENKLYICKSVYLFIYSFYVNESVNFLCRCSYDLSVNISDLSSCTRNQ